MKESEKLYHTITNIREDFIEEAIRAKQTRKPRKNTFRFLGAAACLVFIIGAVTALATDFSVRWLGSRTAPKESGYELAVDMEKKPLSRMSPQLQQVSQIITEQYRLAAPWDNWYPGHWKKHFSDSQEALAFVGLPELKMPDLGLPEEQNSLNVNGLADGTITDLFLQTDYHSGPFRLQSTATVCTEYETEYPRITGAFASEELDFTMQQLCTDRNVSWIMVSADSMQSGYTWRTGYLVNEGILYTLDISFPAENSAQAEKMLQSWANLFPL